MLMIHAAVGHTRVIFSDTRNPGTSYLRYDLADCFGFSRKHKCSP